MPCLTEEGKETPHLIHEVKEQPLEVQGIMGNFLDTKADHLMGSTLPLMLEVFLPMLGLDGVENTMLPIQDGGGLTPSISKHGLSTLRLVKSKIADGRCHAIRHPLWSLREAAFPLWRFQEVEGEMFSYLTLTKMSFRVMKGLVNQGGS